MEIDYSRGASSTHPSGARAQALLHDLSSDRAALADRLQAPRWLYPLIGLIAAGYVASPAIPLDGSVILGILLAASLVLVLSHRRLSGVRPSRAGTRGPGLIVNLVGGVLLLVLISTSFGLVSLLSPWWVLAPALVGFIAALILGRWFDLRYRENMRRGH